MKKLVLLTMAVFLTLGASARVARTERAIQKPVANVPAPVKADMTAKKTNLVSPLKFDFADVAARQGVPAPFINLKEEETVERASYYSRSLGEFFTGFSEEFYGYSGFNYFTYTPAFYKSTYTAYAPEGAALSWTYYTGLGEAYAVDGGSEATLTQDLSDAAVYAPELTANDSTFSWGYMYPGGSAYTDADGITFLHSNQDHSWEWAGAFPNGVNVDDASEYFSDVTEGDGILAGFAEFVNVDPNYPLVLYGVNTIVYCEEMGGTLKLSLYKAKQDEEGNYTGWTDDLITTAEAAIEPDADHYQMVVFSDLQTPDPETGLDGPIVLNEPFVAIITSEDGAQFYPTAHLHNESIATEAHAMLLFNIEDVEYLMPYNRPWNYVSYAEDDENHENPILTPAGYTSAWEFMYDIEYNYIHAEETEIELPAEGGEAEIEASSDYGFKAWDVETADGEDLPEWLTITGENVMDEYTDEETGETTEYFTGKVIVNFSAEALANADEGREAKVRFFFDGAEYVINVKQGNVDEPQPEYPEGDLNKDTKVNVGDVAFLYAALLAGKSDPELDLNKDGSVNAGDVGYLYKLILGASSSQE